MSQSIDSRLDFHWTRRNGDAILKVLKPLFWTVPRDVLEIASGSGQHAVRMASACSNVVWWPSDIDPEHILSIDSWRQDAGLDNMRRAVMIDVVDAAWRRGDRFDGSPKRFDAVVNANMIHVAPWAATAGLIEGASLRLKAGGFLFFYGPFKRNGDHTAESNLAFDNSLREQNPDWGVRDLDDVAACATNFGFVLEQVTEMPANNLSLVFRIGRDRSGSTPAS
jgi:SAM-dependent methyltransferase